MKGEEAMEIFKLVKAKGMLPAKMEDLVPLSFIGQTAVTFYRQMIKGFDQLKMTEAQRKRTLQDGQEAGEMLLDIETRIGELAYEVERTKPIPMATPSGSLIGTKSSGKPLKHERLGMTEKRMKQSQIISKHPDIVERVKAQARENEDIPTRTAVVNEIKYQKEKERRKETEGKQTEVKAIIAIEQVQYLNALDRCITILPQKPPTKWNEDALKEATAKARIIIKRLEVFQ